MVVHDRDVRTAGAMIRRDGKALVPLGSVDVLGHSTRALLRNEKAFSKVEDRPSSREPHFRAGLQRRRTSPVETGVACARGALPMGRTRQGWAELHSSMRRAVK